MILRGDEAGRLGGASDRNGTSSRSVASQAFGEMLASGVGGFFDRDAEEVGDDEDCNAREDG
jgi:hypothetical protein